MGCFSGRLMTSASDQKLFCEVTWESGESVGAIIIRWERVQYISIKSSLLSIFRFSVTNFFPMLSYNNNWNPTLWECIWQFLPVVLDGFILFYFIFWFWFVLWPVDSLDTWDLNSSTQGSNQVLYIARQILNHWSIWEVLHLMYFYSTLLDACRFRIFVSSWWIELFSLSRDILYSINAFFPP